MARLSLAISRSFKSGSTCWADLMAETNVCARAVACSAFGFANSVDVAPPSGGAPSLGVAAPPSGGAPSLGFVSPHLVGVSWLLAYMACMPKASSTSAQFRALHNDTVCMACSPNPRECWVPFACRDSRLLNDVCAFFGCGAPSSPSASLAGSDSTPLMAA